MKRLLFIQLLLILIINNIFTVAFASLANLPFENFTEGNSSYKNKINPTHRRFIFSRFDKSDLIDDLKKISRKKENYQCATNWVSDIKKMPHLKSNKYLQTIIYIMRNENIIDDIVTGILLASLKIQNHFFLMPSTSKRENTLDKEEVKNIYKNSLLKINNSCGEDLWRSLYLKLASKHMIGFGGVSISTLNYLAKRYQYINIKQFKYLQKFQSSQVEKWPLTLKEYYNKKLSVGLRDGQQSIKGSEFVTNIKKGNKYSLRKRLYQRYSPFQIKVLANVLTKLKIRFAAFKAYIVIESDQGKEVIPLNQMERLRMNLKLMRKKLNDLNSTSQFLSKPANYFDIITAAYEMNLVKAKELKYLAQYKEIWSPTKTKKEKIMSWISNFASIGSILIPQPLDILVIIGLMAIDGSTKQKHQNLDKNYTLF